MTVTLEHLLLTLYDSLIETPPWESFLKRMDQYLECSSSALHFQTPTRSDSRLLISEKLDPVRSAAMTDAYKDSPFTELADEKISTLRQLLTEQEHEQKYKAHFDYIRRMDICDLMALNLCDIETGFSAQFRFIKTATAGQFSDKEISKLNTLIPYLKTAISIYSRLVMQQKELYISQETASQLGFGLIVLKADGQILMMNDFAKEILEQRKDFYVQQGRLHCADSEGEEKLRRNLRLLKSWEQDEDCSFQVPCAENSENNWMVTLLRYDKIPLEFREDESGLYSMIVQQRTPISVEQLSRLFDFTPAEAQLTKLLIQGDSLTEAAEKLGRSRSTVRVQLSAIFAKTGVHKQHQLISHIMHTVSKLSL